MLYIFVNDLGFMNQPMPGYTHKCGCDFYLYEITYDKSKSSQSALGVYHGNEDLSLTKNIKEKRCVNQLWLYFNTKNAIRHFDVGPIEKYSNLFASYRLNSDIRHIRRFHKHKDHANSLKNINYVKCKTKQIIWRVMDCRN